MSVASALEKDLNELFKARPPFRSQPTFRVAIAPSDDPDAEYEPDAEYLEYYNVEADAEWEAAEKFVESRDRDRAIVTPEIIVFVREAFYPAKIFKVQSEPKIEYFSQEI